MDIKDTKNRYGKKELNRWLKITQRVREKSKEIIFMVYSKNGFTKGTKEALIENGILVLKEKSSSHSLSNF